MGGVPPIGETLRDARTRQGLEVADVEQATKIRGKYLRALEEEQFDRLPGATFVRTFIRTYAEYLGLDSQLLVEEYRLRHEHPDELEPQTVAPPPSASASRPRESRRRPRVPAAPAGGPSRTTMVAAIVVAVLAVLVVLGLLVGENPPAEDGRGGDPAGAPDDRGSGGGGDSGGTAPQPETVALRITPNTETYVCVENGEGEQLVNANVTEPQTFRGRTLLVNLGNTLGVEIEANGEEVPVEQQANPVGLEFTPEGEQEIPEGERPCQ